MKELRSLLVQYGMTTLDKVLMEDAEYKDIMNKIDALIAKIERKAPHAQMSDINRLIEGYVELGAYQNAQGYQKGLCDGAKLLRCLDVI